MRRFKAAVVAVGIAAVLVGLQREATMDTVVLSPCERLTPDDWFLWWWHGCDKDAAGGGGGGAG